MSSSLRGRRAASRIARITALVLMPLLAALLLAGWAAYGSKAEAGANRSGAGAPRGKARIPDGRRGGGVLEISLDDLVRVNLSDASVVFDRDAATELVQALLGTREPLESILLVDLLKKAPRVRVTWRGISVELGEQMMVLLARRIVGQDVPLRDIRVGDLLEALPDVHLGQDGTPTVAGGEELSRDLGEVLSRAGRFERARDARFLERRDLELQYAKLSALVGQIEQEGLAAAGPDALYEEALGRLFDSGDSEAVPLLEGRRLLDQELATADFRDMTLAERIAFRSEARRRAFGDEAATTLFGRQEAIERYQIDILALEEDATLDEAGRAGRMEERREALRIELAAQGSYVGFVGEDRASVDATLRERLGRRFDEMGEDQKREARRQVYLEQLPPELRDEVESIRGADPGKPRSRGRGRS